MNPALSGRAGPRCRFDFSSAHAIVADEVRRFSIRRRAARLGPLFRALRERGDAAVDAELALLGDGRSDAESADRLVVSIFVNPTQFSPGEDFAAYPRDFERDCALLKQAGVDALFHPSVAEMYPEGAETHVEVERLSLPLCGAARAGRRRRWRLGAPAHAGRAAALTPPRASAASGNRPRSAPD